VLKHLQGVRVAARHSINNNNKHSIYKDLLFWFLLLSITPLTLLSITNYLQARTSLTKAAEQQLKYSAIEIFSNSHQSFC